MQRTGGSDILYFASRCAPAADRPHVMSPEATEVLIIDDTLRYVLYGVSVVLGIDMRASEIERLFAASASGDSTAQSYGVSPLAPRGRDRACGRART